MEDERIEKRALLDLENARQGGRIEPVAREAVNRFRRQTDDLALRAEAPTAREIASGDGATTLLACAARVGSGFILWV